MPASYRLVGHAFLNGSDASPGRWIGSRLADILPTITLAGKAFVGDALALRHPIGAGMAKAAVIHIPAMQKGTGGQGCAPGKGRKTAGCAVGIDQLEELLSDLLRL